MWQLSLPNCKIYEVTKCDYQIVLTLIVINTLLHLCTYQIVITLIIVKKMSTYQVIYRIVITKKSTCLVSFCNQNDSLFCFYFLKCLMISEGKTWMREGVQSIHEPRKLTSGASWFAEWSPSQLQANQNRLRASCYDWQAAQLCLTSNNSISNNKYLAFTSTKSLFFEKSQHVHKVFNGT